MTNQKLMMYKILALMLMSEVALAVDQSSSAYKTGNLAEKYL